MMLLSPVAIGWLSEGACESSVSGSASGVGLCAGVKVTIGTCAQLRVSISSDFDAGFESPEKLSLFGDSEIGLTGSTSSIKAASSLAEGPLTLVGSGVKVFVHMFILASCSASSGQQCAGMAV